MTDTERALPFIPEDTQRLFQSTRLTMYSQWADVCHFAADASIFASSHAKDVSRALLGYPRSTLEKVQDVATSAAAAAAAVSASRTLLPSLCPPVMRPSAACHAAETSAARADAATSVIAAAAGVTGVAALSLPKWSKQNDQAVGNGAVATVLRPLVRLPDRFAAARGGLSNDAASLDVAAVAAATAFDAVTEATTHAHDVAAGALANVRAGVEELKSKPAPEVIATASHSAAESVRDISATAWQTFLGTVHAMLDVARTMTLRPPDGASAAAEDASQSIAAETGRAKPDSYGGSYGAPPLAVSAAVARERVSSAAESASADARDIAHLLKAHPPGEVADVLKDSLRYTARGAARSAGVRIEPETPGEWVASWRNSATSTAGNPNAEASKEKESSWHGLTPRDPAGVI
eukprot:TRINITY_DN45466_c0_g1_i1.p1 TRINITY_DN45466_c0_g1~~TRINITY_DN45466_c0_g1_i1.p1  ORF type:complete len:408 (-),score=49.19 TRINITY_DN45466_c0_g1_i1:157-1380(-)